MPDMLKNAPVFKKAVSAGLGADWVFQRRRGNERRMQYARAQPDGSVNPPRQLEIGF